MAGAKYVNDGTPVTGSFSKIDVVGNGALTYVGARFDDIQFGTGDLNLDDGTNNRAAGSPCHIDNVVADMPVTGSITIDGPIVGFHLVSGDVIAYY